MFNSAVCQIQVIGGCRVLSSDCIYLFHEWHYTWIIERKHNGIIIHIRKIEVFVMHSMKRDLKLANGSLKRVVYLFCRWLFDEHQKKKKKKKSRPKSAKMAELCILKLTVKKLHFEKNYFEIYEPDFWEQINFETFYAQNYSQKVCSGSILNRAICF